MLGMLRFEPGTPERAAAHEAGSDGVRAGLGCPDFNF